MRRHLLAAALIAALPICASAADLPQAEGTCAWTRIARLEHRLQEGEHGPFIPDSGSAVVFADGAYQVSYEELDAIHKSRAGDQVLLCLVRIPRHCPAGDNRGRIYTTTNLRTLESWTLPDSEHSCGGA